MSPAWRFYVRLYAGWAWIAALATGLAVVQAALALPIAALLKRLFDDAVVFSNPSRIALFAVAIIALYLAGDVLLLAATHLNLRVTKSVILRLRTLVIDAVYRLPNLHAPENESGRIHGALVHDTERVDVLSNSLLSRIVPGILATTALLIVLLVLSWKLFLVAGLLVPATWIATRFMRPPLKRSIDRFHTVFENFSTHALAIIRRRDLAKIHGAEHADTATLRAEADELRDVSHRFAWIGTTAGIVQGETAAITGIAVLLAGGALIASGALTLGTLMAFYFTLNVLRANLAMLFGNLPHLAAGSAALENLFLLLGRCEADIYCGERVIDFTGEIRLEDVGFSYGKSCVLTGVTMAIRAEEITALTGPSGAGKTTLTNLILGLSRPREGRLLADGWAYDDIALDALRRSIGYANQDPVIFAATLRDNLVFGSSRMDGDVHAALEISGATDLVSRLSEGLDTWLGENGARLSGGERQRLSITRAVLRRPALLILDEPSNHLGADEVLAILSRFASAYRASAIFVISHDARILQAASHLYAVEGQAVRLQPPSRSALSIAR